MFYLFLILVVLPLVVFFLLENKEYKKSSYYMITKLPFLSVHFNKGRNGEYRTFRYLKRYEATGAKFLFNLYIPKKNGQTTEIDILMICPKGIFVIESKNYGGWIFGSEDQKNWCQTFKSSRGRSHKEYFYNPIMQNRGHIKHLKTFLGEQADLQSIVVFSDRCTLKSIKVRSRDVVVMNRSDIVLFMNNIYKSTPIDKLSEMEIRSIYKRLYPCTQVDEAVKRRHVANIQNNQVPNPVWQSAVTENPVIYAEPVVEATVQDLPDNGTK